MAYESNPAGLGVGKRYGPLFLGGMQGRMKGEGAYTEGVWEVTIEELDASAAQTLTLGPYAQVTEVFAEVEEAFSAADVIDVTLNGTSVLGVTKVVVSALGHVAPALAAAAADYTVGATAEVLTIDTSGVVGATTGKCKIVVRYKDV